MERHGVATNSCGTRTTNPALLSRCIAETEDGSATLDGDVTIDDLLNFPVRLEVAC